jgi:hypothetical protein
MDIRWIGAKKPWIFGGQLLNSSNALTLPTSEHNKLYLPSNAIALEIAAQDKDVENYVPQEIEHQRIKLQPEGEENIIH